MSSLLPPPGGVLMGVSQGLYFGASHPLWARYFGRLHLDKIRGALMTINVAASSIGPLFAGLTRDAVGTFDPALLAFAVLPWPLAIASLWAVPPTRHGDTTSSK
jgi:MFS transporter, OFA family, oxalate/formate antiporter